MARTEITTGSGSRSSRGPGLLTSAEKKPPTTRVWLGEDEGQTALLVDGVVQSVVVDDGPLGPGYWPLMIPETRPDHALILGMGGGTIANLLLRRFGSIRITGVESDPRIIHLARSAFGLDLPNVDIIEGDAFQFVAEADARYGYIAVDLFAANTIPREIFARPFLKRIRALLEPGGLTAINFFRDRRTADRIRRIGEVFPRVEVVDSRKNVVARCRPR
jgi:spermidine synthase